MDASSKEPASSTSLDLQIPVSRGSLELTITCPIPLGQNRKERAYEPPKNGVYPVAYTCPLCVLAYRGLGTGPTNTGSKRDGKCSARTSPSVPIRCQIHLLVNHPRNFCWSLPATKWELHDSSERPQSKRAPSRSAQENRLTWARRG